MPRRRKPFIDKKHATTYRLIPGYVPDEEDEVLISNEEKQARKEEQKKYGVFYEDDYNYMQHLRSLTEGATMVKVSDLNKTDDEVRSSYGGSVNFRMFSTEFETKEEHIDPDILASLDEAPEAHFTEDGDIEIGDEENFLEDDFLTLAGGYEPKAVKNENPFRNQMVEEEQDLGSDFDEDENFDFYNDTGDDDDEFEDPYCDKTDLYASVGRGTAQDDIIEAQTALILKNFQEGLGFSCVAQQIDEDDGKATTEDMENLKEILMQEKVKEKKKMTCTEFADDHANRPVIDTTKYDYEEEEEFEWKELPPKKLAFDCVSILSLNSNTRNLPTDLIPQTSKKKTKKTSESDTDLSSAPGLTRKQLEEEIRLSRKADKASTFRPVDETAEEKKNRKKAIKEERKERRMEKKANKIVFSMEKQQLDKEFAALSKSGKGIRLT